MMEPIRCPLTSLWQWNLAMTYNCHYATRVYIKRVQHSWKHETTFSPHSQHVFIPVVRLCATRVPIRWCFGILVFASPTKHLNKFSTLNSNLWISFFVRSSSRKEVVEEHLSFLQSSGEGQLSGVEAISTTMGVEFGGEVVPSWSILNLDLKRRFHLSDCFFLHTCTF